MLYSSGSARSLWHWDTDYRLSNRFHIAVWTLAIMWSVFTKQAKTLKWKSVQNMVKNLSFLFWKKKPPNKNEGVELQEFLDKKTILKTHQLPEQRWTTVNELFSIVSENWNRSLANHQMDVILVQIRILLSGLEDLVLLERHNQSVINSID